MMQHVWRIKRCGVFYVYFFKIYSFSSKIIETVWLYIIYFTVALTRRYVLITYSASLNIITEMWIKNVVGSKKIWKNTANKMHS